MLFQEWSKEMVRFSILDTYFRPVTAFIVGCGTEVDRSRRKSACGAFCPFSLAFLPDCGSRCVSGNNLLKRGK